MLFLGSAFRTLNLVFQMFEALAKLLLVRLELLEGFRFARIAGQQTLREARSCLFKLLPVTYAEAI